MCLKLIELQTNNKQTKKIKIKNIIKKSCNNINKMLYFQDLLYILEIIYIKLINQYYNNLLASYFKIKKLKNQLLQNTIGKFFVTILKSISKIMIFV